MGKSETNPSATNQNDTETQIKSITAKRRNATKQATLGNHPGAPTPVNKKLRAAQLLALTDVEPVFFEAAR